MGHNSFLLLLFAIGITALPQNPTPEPFCQTLPNDVKLGPSIEMRPQDIPTGCSLLEILVARGTSEFNFKEGNGKFGIVVGDPIVSNVTKFIPGARGYPVQYPADMNSKVGVPKGAKDVLDRLQKQSTLCPDQKFALVGYSQGASVMHAAGTKIPQDIQKKILAVVMFGDPHIRSSPSLLFGEQPRFPPMLEGRLMENCAENDMICDTGHCFYAHLTYMRPAWIDKNVNFIVSAFNGKPLPPKLSGLGL